MKEYIERLRRQSESTRTIRLPGLLVKSGTYDVLVHSRTAASVLAPEYLRLELHAIRRRFERTTEIELDHRGLVCAARRGFDPGEDPTHYDAIWIRDSLWAYLGLRTLGDRSMDAKRVLLSMLEYMCSSGQARRLRELKKVHVRFDASSPRFEDVRVGGVIQAWNHNQNDALGLLLDLALRALEEGFVSPDDLKPEQWRALVLLASYLVRIRFHQMADAGSWEEIERLNTSSVALVTSGLESFLSLLRSRAARHGGVVSRLRKEIAAAGVGRYLGEARLAKELEKGYQRIHAQLSAGGESPGYLLDDPRYREADAALLNLIYPARLSRLTSTEKRAVLRSVRSLAGRAGIRRYRGDSYQSGNFWFVRPAPGSKRRSPAEKSREEFVARARNSIPDTEAQWFFDSWYSLAAGALFAASVHSGERDVTLKAEQVQFFNRAIGQITSEKRLLGADGNPVPPLAVPESYNTLVLGGASYFAPSPICPLNWAKAALLLALSEMERSANN